MNSSKNHQHKSQGITNRTSIAPSSCVTTCQGMAGNVPSLSPKHLQAVPGIVLCPTLWRLSILKKRHRPPTTQAIKKPRPPSITVPAKARLRTELHLRHVPTARHAAVAEVFQTHARDPAGKPQTTLHCSQSDDKKKKFPSHRPRRN